MLEKTCSHRYVDPKMDKTSNAYYFMLTYLSRMAFHVSNTSLLGLGRFSISLHLCSWVRMNLDTHKSLSAMSASSISRSGWLTPVNADIFSRDMPVSSGVTGKDNVLFLV